MCGEESIFAAVKCPPASFAASDLEARFGKVVRE
jgi:hypothetical protein